MHLLFLHGPPAAGKLTTARALSSRVGYPVFHNHLVVDTLTTVLPFGSEPFIRLREQFWLEVLTEAARAERSLVFTFAPDATVAAGFPARARAAVEDQGATVHFIRLAVSSAEQERRIGNPDRAEFHKLQDLATLRRLRDSDASVEQPPVDLEIETDQSSPEQSADRIVQRFSLPIQAAAPRYPEA